MARTKIYQHFCPVARTLEVIGEKWSLLIVRDLLRGPARFTDLSRTLGNITPKWLVQRLRELEAAGIVERDQEEGRREVWYRLTPAGRELGPVVGALNAWGLDHAMRMPEPGERVDPGTMMQALFGYLVTTRLRPAGPRTWLFAFTNGDTFALRFDGRRWEQSRTEPGLPADVTITARPEEFAAFLAASGAERRAAFADLRAAGSDEAIEEFLTALRAGDGPAIS